MGGYFPLNAAIKNTCILDPQKNDCPQSIADIISIEPETFIPLTKNASLTIYDFHPREGRYTLVVREGEYAIIFDPRLIKATDYRIDSVAYGVASCGNKHTIIDPPKIPGPWDNIN